MAFLEVDRNALASHHQRIGLRVVLVLDLVRDMARGVVRRALIDELLGRAERDATVGGQELVVAIELR